MPSYAVYRASATRRYSMRRHRYGFIRLMRDYLPDDGFYDRVRLGSNPRENLWISGNHLSGNVVTTTYLGLPRWPLMRLRRVFACRL